MIINPMALSGRTVLVTGASSGLGRSSALLLASLGARVVLVGRNRDRLASTAIELDGGGHQIEEFDLRKIAEIPGWMKSVVSKHGRLNGLVHSAGMLQVKPLRLQTHGDWETAMTLNVMSAGALVKGFRTPEVNSGGGSVVFLTSVMGLVGQPGQIIYSATKGALVSLTRSMAMELAREGIRVNCVAPAVVDAGMSAELRQMMTREAFERVVALHPLGLGRPEDVAHAVAFLVADTARWITGTTLVVDGGYTSQ